MEYLCKQSLFFYILHQSGGKIFSSMASKPINIYFKNISLILLRYSVTFYGHCFTHNFTAYINFNFSEDQQFPISKLKPAVLDLHYCFKSIICTSIQFYLKYIICILVIGLV